MKTTNLQKGLLALRYGVFLVMLMWTLDKFVNPEHTGKIFAKYYLLGGVNNIIAYVLGSLQLILVLAFGLGIKKRVTYGLIFFMHAVSTLSTFSKYIEPWQNLLFFAAWPMLAAIYALYILRDEDTLLTIK
jgi:hypothetical protein